MDLVCRRSQDPRRTKAGPLGALFAEKPLIPFVSDRSHCPRYDHPSQVWKTYTREVVSLRIGHFIAHETQGYCPRCADRPIFRSEELHQLVLPRAQYGYDVMEFVGQAMFLRCRNVIEIRHELSEKNIRISKIASWSGKIRQSSSAWALGGTTLIFPLPDNMVIEQVLRVRALKCGCCACNADRNAGSRIALSISRNAACHLSCMAGAMS
jgi:hypothetical protein